MAAIAQSKPIASGSAARELGRLAAPRVPAVPPVLAVPARAFELRGVTAARQADANRRRRAFAVVVLVEPAAQPAGFDAHDRIEPRIVFLVALEHLDADRVLLQLIGFAGQRLFDDVAQQFAEAAGGRKALRGEDAIELGANVRLGDRRHVASMSHRRHRKHRRGRRL